MAYMGGLPFPTSGSPSAKKMQAFSEPTCSSPFPIESLTKKKPPQRVTFVGEP